MPSGVGEVFAEGIDGVDVLADGFYGVLIVKGGGAGNAVEDRGDTVGAGGPFYVGGFGEEEIAAEFSVGAGVDDVPLELLADDEDFCAIGIGKVGGIAEVIPDAFTEKGEEGEDDGGGEGPGHFQARVAVGVDRFLRSGL